MMWFSTLGTDFIIPVILIILIILTLPLSLRARC